MKSPLAGDFITLECKNLMEDQNIEVVPPYMIASKVRGRLVAPDKLIAKVRI